MKKGALALLILVLAAVGAASTCPPQAAHEAAIKEVVRLTLEAEQATAKAAGNSGGMLGGYLGQMLGQIMAKEMMKAGVMTYHSFILFSTSEVNWDGKTYPVGVGAFGQVHITSRVKDKIQEGIATAKQTMEDLGQQ